MERPPAGKPGGAQAPKAPPPNLFNRNDHDEAMLRSETVGGRKIEPQAPVLSIEEIMGDYHANEVQLHKKKGKRIDPTKLKRVASQVILNQDKHGKRSTWAKIYLHPAFENAALGVICCNAVWIGFDIDWNNRDGSGIPGWFFEVGESTFCAVFLLELIVRVLAYRHKEQFFYDPDMRKWNIFDLFMVLSMVLDTWVMTYLLDVDAGSLKLLSTLRLLRLMRLTRLLRLVPELGMMVKSMLAAVRSVASTCILGLGIMYIFAILFCQWVKSYGSEGKCIGYENALCLQDYFGTIALSFLALMQILVFDDTFEIVRPIFKERFHMGVALIVYIILVSFTVLNMLIGIICDIVSETTASEREKQLKRRVEEIFRSLDTDGSDTITRDEFQGEALDQLEMLGIEPQVMKNAFDILDVDRDGQLECEEFIKMIFKCLHAPQSEDILEIEARVDGIADQIGLGRSAIQVIDKERRPSVGGEQSMAPSLHDLNPTGRSPWMESVQKAAQNAAKKARVAKEAIEEKAAEETEYARRLKSVGRHLGNVLLLAEAGSLTTKGIAQAKANGELLMLEDGAGGTANGAVDSKNKGPAFPNGTLLTILRPAMRALDARLHALRAECKASGMKHAGNLAGSQGEDIIPRQNLAPLDELISEVISRLSIASGALRVTSTLDSTGGVRQRDVIATENGVTISSRSADRAKRKHRPGPSGPKETRPLVAEPASPFALAAPPRTDPSREEDFTNAVDEPTSGNIDNAPIDLRMQPRSRQESSEISDVESGI